MSETEPIAGWVSSWYFINSNAVKESSWLAAQHFPHPPRPARLIRRPPPQGASSYSADLARPGPRSSGILASSSMRPRTCCLAIAHPMRRSRCAGWRLGFVAGSARPLVEPHWSRLAEVSYCIEEGERHAVVFVELGWALEALQG